MRLRSKCWPGPRSHLKTQLGKNPLPSSCGCWQNSVLCRSLDLGPRLPAGLSAGSHRHAGLSVGHLVHGSLPHQNQQGGESTSKTEARILCHLFAEGTALPVWCLSHSSGGEAEPAGGLDYEVDCRDFCYGRWPGKSGTHGQALGGGPAVPGQSVFLRKASALLPRPFSGFSRTVSLPKANCASLSHVENSFPATPRTVADGMMGRWPRHDTSESCRPGHGGLVPCLCSGNDDACLTVNSALPPFLLPSCCLSFLPEGLVSIGCRGGCHPQRCGMHVCAEKVHLAMHLPPSNC